MKYEFDWVEDLDGIIYGQLTDGRYFLGYEEYVIDDYVDDHTVWFFDVDPYDYVFGEDCDPIDDCVDTYSIGELTGNEKYDFWDEFYAFLDANA